MTTPNIEVTRTWSASNVRDICIENGYYTHGTNEDYEHMLNWVNRLYPNNENMYFIAKDIYEHSHCNEPIASIMFLLEREAVITFFDIK